MDISHNLLWPAMAVDRHIAQSIVVCNHWSSIDLSHNLLSSTMSIDRHRSRTIYFGRQWPSMDEVHHIYIVFDNVYRSTVSPVSCRRQYLSIDTSTTDCRRQYSSIDSPPCLFLSKQLTIVMSLVQSVNLRASCVCDPSLARTTGFYIIYAFPSAIVSDVSELRVGTLYECGSRLMYGFITGCRKIIMSHLSTPASSSCRMEFSFVYFACFALSYDLIRESNFEGTDVDIPRVLRLTGTRQSCFSLPSD